LSRADATGVLLAAGRGTRLSPLSDEIPKAVLPMLDVPLGGFGLARLLSLCPAVIVNATPQTRLKLEAELRPVAEGMSAGAMSIAEESPEPYGTAGTLAAVRDRIDERVVTWNADAISDLDLVGLLDAHLSSGTPATIAVMRVSGGADFFLEQGHASAYINRHLRPDASGGRFIGVAVFEKVVLDALSGQRPLGMAEAMLEPLVSSGDLGVYEHSGYTADVGTFTRYLEASIDLLEGRGPEAPIGWAGEFVSVDGGLSYVGPGASVAPGTLGAGAVVLAGAQVEAGARIEHSIVWRGAVVHGSEVVRGAVWPWFPDRRTNV
jgi:mannose-1-phosphate guanylyltransferase